jgi:AcrR family transcriptional regulator
MTPPQQGRSAATVAAVVEEARDLFGRRGFSDVGLDLVAERCGRTKGAIYHHFATKEALFEEVFIREQRRLAGEVVAAATSGDAVTALTDGIARYLELIAADPIACRITLLDAPGVLGWLRWRRCDGGPFRQLCADALDQVAQAERLRGDHDPGVLADLVLGAVTEAALMVATSAEPAEAAAVAAECCSAFVTGITT